MGNNRLILWIVAGVFLWGTLHAVGAYLYNHHIGRAVVVMLCVDGFLVFWLILMLLRKPGERYRNGNGHADEG